MPAAIQRYEIFDYLHVGEDDYLNLLNDARENNHPLPQRRSLISKIFFLFVCIFFFMLFNSNEVLYTIVESVLYVRYII